MDVGKENSTWTNKLQNTRDQAATRKINIFDQFKLFESASFSLNVGY